MPPITLLTFVIVSVWPASFVGPLLSLASKLAIEIARTLKHPDNQGRLAAMGFEVIASTPDEFRKAIGSEIQRWAKVVKDANIKPE